MALLEIKSQFDAEFRRISLPKSNVGSYDNFKSLLECLHQLSEIPFVLTYIDPKDKCVLPINNDDNLQLAVLKAKPLLRIIIQRKCESNHLWISNPQDFRQVSSIIDVDIVPRSCRRVRLLKHSSEQPLGFYIKYSTSIQVGPSGIKKVPGIFISRLVPGGLANSTGLLNINDEILEVNGIGVVEKTLDQVTDMMLANSNNLIITVKLANRGATMSRPSQEFQLNY